MKLSTKVALPLLTMAAVGAATLAPHAQTAPNKVGFVDVQRLFAAHPSANTVNANIKTIETRANTELGQLRQQMVTISQKGNAATAAEKQSLTQLEATFKSKYEAYGKQIADQSAPIEKAVDAAINKVAKANGYSVVMDRNVAAQGLVVFAEPTADLTEAVMKELK
ncbi:OmpH family outer membrane protein [Deinococcus lacus]|uniref:OmpH family outer membrane protein n=1 Tax=Deinococcus lacus TaxID=392561 RepID=A0ABW1YDB8_9DEIO